MEERSKRGCWQRIKLPEAFILLALRCLVGLGLDFVFSFVDLSEK